MLFSYFENEYQAMLNNNGLKIIVSSKIDISHMGRGSKIEEREKEKRKGVINIELRCVLYTYQLYIRNVNIMYYRHVLLEIKIMKKHILKNYFSLLYIAQLYTLIKSWKFQVSWRKNIYILQGVNIKLSESYCSQLAFHIILMIIIRQ